MSEQDDSPEPEKKSGGTGCLLVLLAGFAFFVLIALLGDDSEEDEGPTSVAAIDVCEQHVTDLLRAPSTADFGGQQASLTSSGNYTVTGWVDAENGFGANLRTDWTCTATHVDGENWRTRATLSD